MTYYVYIIECIDTTLYTGVTTDIEKRIFEHKNRTGAKYTKSHPYKDLLALWKCEGRSNAQKLEYRIKQLTRERKKLLISDNLHFCACFPELDSSEYIKIEKSSLT